MPLPDPNLLPLVLKAEQVATLLNYSGPRTFHESRRRLESRGFPAKLPGINGWSRDSVLRWIDSNGATAAPAEPVDDRGLERKYA